MPSNLQNEARKYLGCRITGNLGKTKSRKEYGIMASRDDCMRALSSKRNKKIYIHDNGYIGVNTVNKSIFKNGFSIYQDILDLEALALRRICGAVDKVVAVKTDCVVYEGNHNLSDFISSEPGLLKKEGVDSMTSCVHQPVFMGVHKPEIEVVDTKFEGGISCSKAVSREYRGCITEYPNYELTLADWMAMMFGELISSQTKTRGIHVKGLAGTGKSVVITGVEEENELRISYTNAGARIINGETIHMGLGLMHNKSKRYDVVKIDEISQIPHELWIELYHYKLKYNPFFLLCGDEYQCNPISEISVDLQVMISIFCDKSYTLTKNWRSEDTEEAYHTILSGGKVDLKTMACTRAVCRTNKTRKAFNHMVMNTFTDVVSIDIPKYSGREKKDGTIYVDRDLRKYSQDVKLTVGTPVIPIKNNRSAGYYKNVEYEITCLNPLTISDDIELENFDHFIVNWAVTVFRSQGSTYDFKYNLLDLKAMANNERYVAISRCTSIKNVCYFPSHLYSEMKDSYALTSE
jgi:hypothetical protein